MRVMAFIGRGRFIVQRSGIGVRAGIIRSEIMSDQPQPSPARSVIAQLGPWLEKIEIVAGLTATVCALMILINIADPFAAMLDQAASTSDIWNKPFGSWSFIYIGHLLNGAFIVLAGAIHLVATRTLFWPTVVAVVITWSASRAKKYLEKQRDA